MAVGLSLDSMLAMVMAQANQRRQHQQAAPALRADAGAAQPGTCPASAGGAQTETRGAAWDTFADRADTRPDSRAEPVAPHGDAAAARDSLYQPQAATAEGTAAADAAPEATPAAAFAFRTNQEAINHFYRVGGGTWEGASRAAREAGLNLNALVRNRQGAFAGGTPTAPTNPTPAAAFAFRTNQEAINHFYRVGGGTWEGASRAAREAGLNLNALVRNRQGAFAGGTPTAPTNPTAPTTPSEPIAPTAPTAPGATGTARSIKGFREVDVNRLRQALPPQAQHLAEAFIDSGRRHNVDPLALVAISMHETGNFTSSAFRNKNNAMGISDSRGPTMQPSHEASIDRMARLLGSTSSGPYRNARTIGEVAGIYAPIGASNDPTGLNNHWARGVARFADELEQRVRGGVLAA
jgi:hypothetical protein